MKRSELFFNAIVLPTDYIALLVSGMVAYYLRVSPYVQTIRPAQFTLDLPFGEYMQLVAIVSAIIIIIFAIQGMYAMRARRRISEEVTKIFSGISLGIMLIIVYIFLTAELFQSRFILLTAYIVAVILVTLGRFIVRRMQMMAVRRGYGIYRVALVGNGPYGSKLSEVLKQNPEAGYKIVTELDTMDRDTLETVNQTVGIDEIIQTDPNFSDEKNLSLIDFSDEHKIDFKYVPNLFETVATNVSFRQLAGIPVVELLRTPLDGWGRIAKRVMDLSGAIIGGLVISPLLLLTALIVKLDSPGRIFYKQKRIGRNKQPFILYKFRTMKTEYCIGEEYGGKKAEEFYADLRKQTNERQGPLFKMKGDPRITKVGRFLRRWRLDELPQLYNVLRGEMSLIGPRPHLPEEVAKYSKHHRKLFTIKPGMSGMAQVNGSSGLTFNAEAKFDIGYIEFWSLKLDIILLLKTFRILFTDKNAI